MYSLNSFKNVMSVDLLLIESVDVWNRKRITSVGSVLGAEVAARSRGCKWSQITCFPLQLSDFKIFSAACMIRVWIKVHCNENTKCHHPFLNHYSTVWLILLFFSLMEKSTLHWYKFPRTGYTLKYLLTCFPQKLLSKEYEYSKTGPLFLYFARRHRLLQVSWSSWFFQG